METILSIAGKPGLYRLVSRGKMNLIVESLDEARHRMPAFASDRVTSLADIAMYTDSDDVPLWQVLESLGERKRRKSAGSTIKNVPRKSCMPSSRRCFPTTTATVCTTVTSRNLYSGTTSL